MRRVVGLTCSELCGLCGQHLPPQAPPVLAKHCSRHLPTPVTYQGPAVVRMRIYMSRQLKAAQDLIYRPKLPCPISRRRHRT